jgi:hypothetical protein
MTDTPDTPTSAGPSPLQQIPPAETIRRRLADLAHERSLLQQMLRLAVRRERDCAARATEGGPEDAA